MNVSEKITELIKISEYMNQNDIIETLKSYEYVLEDGRYILSFMGQFSAGKSCLINNLIGRDILPVHITETTALITYIEYSEDECVVLEKTDGTENVISFEESLEIWQNGKTNDEISDISVMHIYVNNDLLKNGLVIADTPGINTVFQPHIEKTVRLLQSSNRIVYVMSKTASASDIDFLKCIHDNGVEIILVRTHMDLIKKDEEDFRITVENETEELKSFSDDPVFFLSSVKESSFYSGISKLREYISEKLSENIKSGLSEAIDKKLILVSKTLYNQLNIRKSMAEEFVANESCTYESRKRELEETIVKLNAILNKNKDDAVRKYHITMEEADKDLKNNSDNAVNRICEEIKCWDFTENKIECSAKIERMVKEECLKLREHYISYFDGFITEDKKSICDKLGDCIAGISIDEYIPESIEASDDMVNELNSKINSLEVLQQSLKDELSECRNKILEADENIDVIREEEKNIKEAMNMVKDELSNYGDYVERYKIQKGDHKNEQKMKTAGALADVVSILIPGETWARCAVGLLEGARFVKNGTKIGKIIKETDTVSDVARGIHTYKKNSMEDEHPEYRITEQSVYEGESGKRALQEQLKEKPPGLLDFLSIEYYFRKIGKNFDTPDRVVPDEEWAKQYEEGKKKILSKYQKLGEEEAEKRIRILHITDEKEQSELKSKEIKKSLSKSEREIEAIKKQIDETCKKKENMNYISHYSECVRKLIYDFMDSIMSDLKPAIDDKMSVYFDTYGLKLKMKIQQQNDMLMELSEKYSESGIEECRSEIEFCDNYIKYISEEIF